MDIILVAAGTFLVCWLLDKAFHKLFRNQPQHQTGMAVHLTKYYGLGGLLLVVLGIAAVLVGIKDGWALCAGGGILIVFGIGLLIYFMTFGVFYDEDSFVLSTFGRKSVTYRYSDIVAQQLYHNASNVIIELHLKNGRAVQLQSNMVGVYPFLDKAFAGWLKQTGRRQEDCAFYNPEDSCWFPPVEG